MSKKPPVVEPKTDPEPKNVPEDPRMTMDEAINWFRANPHQTTFISLDKPGTAIAGGGHYIKFKDGEFITSDPAEVEALLRCDVPGAKYGTHFVALEPELRNLR